MMRASSFFSLSAPSGAVVMSLDSSLAVAAGLFVELSVAKAEDCSSSAGVVLFTFLSLPSTVAWHEDIYQHVLYE